MIATDFHYNNLCLSYFGCIVCTFDSSGLETISMGSELTFQTTPVQNGKRHMITSARYENCIEADFSICKNPNFLDSYDDRFFTLEEQRNIMRWLNRPNVYAFVPLSSSLETHCIVNNADVSCVSGLYPVCNRLHDYNLLYYGSFNVSKIELNGQVIGMDLHFQSDSPFGYGRPINYSFSINSANGTYTIVDENDEIGYNYVEMNVTPRANGNLVITNQFDGRRTEIKNCISGEVISMNNLIIATSSPDHKNTIMNDFNYNFPTICNTFSSKNNTFKFSLPCDVEIIYSPIKKVGI